MLLNANGEVVARGVGGSSPCAALFGLKPMQLSTTVMRYCKCMAACMVWTAACRSDQEVAPSSSRRAGDDGVEGAAQANDPGAAPPATSTFEATASARTEAPPSGDITFPPDWCDRALPDPYETLGGVAWDYIDKQIESCATAKLLRSLSDEQTIAWSNYMVDYTHALAGCAIPDASLGGRGFLPGGIGQFGPANLAAIDAPQPQLGRDDASVLIDQYLGFFSDALLLSDVERAGVRAFLQAAAEPRVDDSLSRTLSACDAGSSGG